MDPGETLHARDARLWLEQPLPLVEVGSQLRAADPDYFHRLLALAENMITLAGAIGLARVSAHGVDLRETVTALLESPSLGKRVDPRRLFETGVPPWRRSRWPPWR